MYGHDQFVGIGDESPSSCLSREMLLLCRVQYTPHEGGPLWDEGVDSTVSVSSTFPPSTLVKKTPLNSNL